MPKPIVVLFWLWVLFSLSVYGYRLWRRVARGARAGEPAPGTDGSVVRPMPTPEANPATAPGMAASGTGPGTWPDPAAVPPAPTEGPAPVRATGGRAGLFAPDPLGSAERAGGRVPVADAVAGIAMPCNLAPLTGGDGDATGPFRVAFATTSAAPAVVGAGVADELERLGYRVQTVAENQAVARRDEVELTVTVHLDADLFPTAPPGSVVVTLAT